MKSLTRAAALFAVATIVVVAAFAVACGGAAERPPSSTPATPPATAAVSGAAPAGQFDCTKFAAVCSFAASAERSLRQRDVAAAGTISEAVTVTCPGPEPTAIGGPFPLCEGAQQGESRTGYRTSNQSRSGFASVDQLANLSVFQPPRPASDGYGGADNRVFGIGCPKADSPSCTDQFVIMASGLPQTLPGRPVYLLTVKMIAGSGYRIVDWLTVLSPSIEILKDGGDAPHDYPGAQNYRFYPVKL